jgi:negative regulator of sigma E activity
MNTHNTQSADDLLHAWIDGELPPEQEQRFYTMLASDAEYRERLRQFQTIRSHALRYGAQSAPPAEIGTQLLQRLGLNAKRAPVRKAVVFPFLSSIWSPVASAAAAAFITAVVILGMQKQTQAFENANLAQQTSSSINATPSVTANQTPSGNTSPQWRPQESSRTVPLVRQAAPVSETAVSSTLPTERIAANMLPDDTESTAGVNPAPEAATVATTPHVTQFVESAGTEVSVAPADLAENQRPVALPSASSEPTGYPVTTALRDAHSGYRDGPAPYPQQIGLTAADILTIEVRGVTASSFPRATIPSNPAPWMENMVIGLFYPDEHTDLGVEYGQEAFSQHYSGKENGKYVRYEQNLRSSWLVATVRQRLGRIEALAGLEPYATISAGATFELWPLLKSGVGLMYMPDHRVRFHVGLEGALLAFPYQEKWFTSKRAGITYGLSVLF